MVHWYSALDVSAQSACSEQQSAEHAEFSREREYLGMDTTQQTQIAEQAAQELVKEFDLYQRVLNFCGPDSEWTEWEKYAAQNKSNLIDGAKLYAFLAPEYRAYHEAFFAAITEKFEHPLFKGLASANPDERMTFAWYEWNLDLLTDITRNAVDYSDPAIVLTMIASARLVKTTTWHLANDLADVAKHLHLNLNAGLDFAITAICDHIVFKYRSL